MTHHRQKGTSNVRRHAKASSASTAHRGSRLGGAVRGAFETRGASRDGDGSSAPSHARARLSALALAIAALALLALAPGASASAPFRAYSASFGTYSGNNPRSLAVDQATGDVYVSNGSTVARYDSTGAADNFTCTVGDPGCTDGGTNTLAGQSFGFFAGQSQIAVDNSGGPTEGNVYVTSSSGAIKVYARNGTLLTTLTGTDDPAGAFGSPCGVAVDDSSGEFYVVDNSGNVMRYTPSGATPLESDYSGAIAPGLVGPCNVAADSGHVYVVDWAAGFGSGPLVRFRAADFATGPTPPSVSGQTIVASGAISVGIEPLSGNVYADEGSQVAVYQSGVTPGDPALYSFGSSADFGTNSAGIAVANGGNAYVSDLHTGGKQVDVYGPQAPSPFRAYSTSFGTYSGNNPRSLAVDQATGDVYVSNGSTVARYDSTGAADNFTCTVGDPGCTDGGTNTLAGQSFGFFAGQSQIAVDNSGGPTEGNVYVTSSSGAIKVYARNGTLLTTLTGTDDPAGAFGSPCGVAVDDSSGEFYVVDNSGNVMRYTPSGATPLESDYSGAIAPGLVGPCNVAADSGHVYVVDWAAGFGSGPLVRFRAADFATGPTPPSVSGQTIVASGAISVGIEPLSGNVYADEGSQVAVYQSGVTPGDPALYSFGSSADFGTNSAGIAVANGGNAYVSDLHTGGKQVDVYTNENYGAAAAATTNAANPVSHTTATLNGHLDPGIESISDCHFEWGTDTSYSGGTVGCNEGNSFATAADVTADLTGLHPGTTYHFRLVITGSVSGVVHGADQSFTATDFPRFTDAATALNHTVATLNGHFDPQGDSNLDVTECHFDWGTDNSYGKTAPCAQGNSFSSPASVSAALTGLHAGTTYHFRLHLTTATAGEFTGADTTVVPTAFPVVTDDASGISHTTASLNGHFDPQGDSQIFVTSCRFDWGTDTSYGGGTVPCIQGNSFNTAASVSAFLPNLHPGTTYHVRLELGTANGDTYHGADKTLVPTAFPVSTDAASTVHHTDLTLNGHFDPQNDPKLGVSDCRFDWGTDTSYGNSAPCAQGNSFTAPASVSAFLNNLNPGATYHFRLDLTTVGAGQFTGQDQTATLPLFQTNPPTQVAAFGPDGTSATSFTGNNFDPSALAVDPANHRLYVGVNGANFPTTNAVYGFDVSTPGGGNYPPLAAFDPLSTGGSSPSGFAVAGGNLYLASTNATSTGGLKAFDSSGNPLSGNFPIDPTVNPGGATGSPFQGRAVTVAPDGGLWYSNGYTFDQQDHPILRYSSAGAFQSALTLHPSSPAFGKSNAGKLDFDADGNLYVSYPSFGGVYRFTQASGYATATAFGPDAISSRPGGLGVDRTAGTVYVVKDLGGGSGTRIVGAYSARTGAHLYDFNDGVFQASPYDLAADPSSHYLYLSDQTDHKVHVFAPGASSFPPTLTEQDPTDVAGSSVTLRAKVDPETFQVTDCHFEVVPDSQFQSDGYSSVSADQKHDCAPDAAGIGSGSGDVAVHADLSGLNGGTTYHSRIVASNAAPGGTATGTDQTFTTTGPTVSGTAADHVSDTAATLRAQVNPNGHDTSYQFQYVSDAEFQNNGFANAQNVPANPADVGDGGSAVAVSEQIGGLDPATTYHFRLVAVSSAGTGEGPDTTLTTYSTPPSFGSGCPNDSLRSGPSAALPDCRAYEQVSPVDKHGFSVFGQIGFNQAAADGSAATYGSHGDLPTSGGNGNTPTWVASRGADGWSSDGTLPLSNDAASYPSEVGRDDALTTALSVVPTAYGDNSSQLYSTDLSSFDRRPLSLALPTDRPRDVQFAEDTGHFIFAYGPGPLTGDAATLGSNQTNLYDYDHGTLTLAGRVPPSGQTSCDDSTSAPACLAPAAGAFAGAYDIRHGGDLSSGNSSIGYKQNTISDDGSKVFFTEGGTGRLYERLDNTQTIQLNADQGGNDPGGPKPAAFGAATPSGSEVFFTSCEKLTADSTAVSTAANTCLTPSQGQDLYAYDTSTGELSDLTVDSGGSDAYGAQVQGVLGATPGGDYVYFAANGVLAAGAVPGDCRPGPSGTGEELLLGACNLYLWHAGAVSFVSRLGGNDSALDTQSDYQNWMPSYTTGGENTALRTSRVAANGVLLFSSTRGLTGYHNAGPCGVNLNGSSGPLPAPCLELYRFDPAGEGGNGRLDCVSCNPTGAPPTSRATLVSDRYLGFVPGIRNVPQYPYLTRNLSPDGSRVFFESPDKLVAADTNGSQDVYEWEADGSGSCHSSDQNGGCLYLLSSGTSEHGSFLDDASASGNDVFIFTDSQLVPQDTDHLYDLYDVRVDGGLASQHATSPPACAGADQCHGAPTAAPVNQGAGSAANQGPGNPTPHRKHHKAKKRVKRCRKGFVKHNGKCVKKHKAKRHHKKHKRAKHHKRAGSNRGGQK